MVKFSFGASRRVADGPEAGPTQADRARDEARLASALERLMISQGLEAADLPDGPVKSALHRLRSMAREQRLADLSSTAALSKEASEAAINVGWITYDVGAVATATQTIAAATEELVASIAQVADTSEGAGTAAQDSKSAMAACLDELRQVRHAMQAIPNALRRSTRG